MHCFQVYRIKLNQEYSNWHRGHAFGVEWEEAKPYDFLMCKLMEIL